MLCTLSGGPSFTSALSCVQQVTWPPRVTERAKELSCRLAQRPTENSDNSPVIKLKSLCEATWQEALNNEPVLFLQVVVMEGMNTTGRKLMASKLYEVKFCMLRKLKISIK